MRLLTVRSWVRDPREAFFIKKKKRKGYGEKEKIKDYSKRAHSSVVEHRTAVPVVIGSNPIVPFLFFQKYFFFVIVVIIKSNKEKNKLKKKKNMKYIGFVVQR